MDTASAEAINLRDERRLSPRWLALLVAVSISTSLLTWRAHRLEQSITEEEETPALVSKAAPDFSALALDGATVSLSSYRGKQVLVAFWASWCGPCNLEMNQLADFYRKNHKETSDFEFLAVSIDENEAEATRFATAHKLGFPVLLDPRSKVAGLFGVEGIPTTFMVGKNGIISSGHVGYDAAMTFRLAQELGIKNFTGTD